MSRIELQVGEFSRALASVRALVDIAPISFDKDGFYIETVDASSVGAVSMKLEPTAFDEYEADGLEAHLDVEQIGQILHKFDNSKNAELEYDPEMNRFDLTIGSFSFDLSMIHPESVRSGRKAGNVDPPAELIIKAEEFQKAVRLAEMFSDEIILGVDSDREVFYLNALGDSDSMAVSFDRTAKEVSLVDTTRAHSIYSLSYLSQMTKSIPSSQDITIKLGEEFPAKLKFEIAEGDGEVVYGLAPRVS